MSSAAISPLSQPSPINRSDIAAKAAELPRWLADFRNKQYHYQTPTTPEVLEHLVDWVRIHLDDCHSWRFPKTGLCSLRLTVSETEVLPTAKELLRIWRKKTSNKSKSEVYALKLAATHFNPL